MNTETKSKTETKSVIKLRNKIIISAFCVVAVVSVIIFITAKALEYREIDYNRCNLENVIIESVEMEKFRHYKVSFIASFPDGRTKQINVWENCKKLLESHVGKKVNIRLEESYNFSGKGNFSHIVFIRLST